MKHASAIFLEEITSYNDVTNPSGKCLAGSSSTTSLSDYCFLSP
jgi:hypothetical protein